MRLLLLCLVLLAGRTSAHAQLATAPLPLPGGAAPVEVEDFGGIGAVLNKDAAAQSIYVAALLPGLAAERAGLQPNDVLVEVGGVTAYGKDLAEVVAMIRGPVGSSVEIVVVRDPTLPPLRMTVVREAIRAPK